MKIRLASHVNLKVNIDQKDSDDVIAPLIFISLIENAFKYGMDNTENVFIHIDILTKSGIGVICTVENSLKNMTDIKEQSSGIGLTNLSRRLDLLYPGKHELITEKRTDSFYVSLRINFDNHIK
jgi:LytS/YehU family sensor histidine kinase